MPLERKAEAVVVVARQHMNMEVEHGLESDGAVGLQPADPRNPNAQSINDPEVSRLVGTFFRTQPRADNTRTKDRAGPAIGRETERRRCDSSARRRCCQRAA